jgi:ribosomal-protein-alanine N-acetyltransferase
VSAQEPVAARVRPATEADVDAVAELEQAIFGDEAWSRDSVLHELTQSLRQAHVAVDEVGEIFGYVVVLGVGDVVDLQRVAVADTHRRRGVAAALLDACDLHAHARVMLEVRADNEAALAFYRRNGFAEISRRRGYFADGADAVVMQRPVADSLFTERADR